MRPTSSPTSGAAWNEGTAREAPSGGEVQPARETNRFVATAGFVQAAVDRETGAPASYMGDTEFLKAPLTPSAWEEPNDNQRGNDYRERLGAWRTARPRIAPCTR